MSVRPARSYIQGLNGPVVVVPARVCAFLERRGRLDELRNQAAGGVDAEVFEVLEAIRLNGSQWLSSVRGTAVAEPAEPVTHSEWLTSSQVADRMQITPRGIRKAAAKGKLQGELIDQRWRFRREDVEHFKAAREARE